jgi:hypothetical protein
MNSKMHRESRIFTVVLIMNFRKITLSMFWLLGVLGRVHGGPASPASMSLVRGGRPEVTIVIGTQATMVERFAAEELQSYVGQITGASEKIPIVIAGGGVIAGPANEIIIGRPETNPRLAALGALSALRLDTNFLGDDGYIIKSINTGTNNALILSGSNDRSSLFAVYHLLETCGVRFYGYKSRNGEIVPHLTALSIPPLDIVEKPRMKYRFVSDNGFNADNKTELIDVADWGAKNRCNAFMLTPSRAGESWSQIDLEEVQKRGFLIAGPGHFLARLTPDEKLFATHPEYFPLIKGKRNPVYSPAWGGATAFCWSNPDAMRIVVGNAVKYFQENPFIDLLAIYPPDGSQHGSQCQDPLCSQQTMSDWYLTLLNNIDAALRQLPSHPKLMWISYNECSVPPPHAQPLDGGKDFILVWCNELRDHREPMDSPANRRASRVLQWKPRLKSIKTDWMKNPGDQNLAAYYRWQNWNHYLTSGGYEGSVTVLDYYNAHVAKSLSIPMLDYCQSGPWPDNVMQKDFEFYGSQRISGWQNCTDYYNDKPNSYWNRLSARLMWNPSEDVAAIDRDFYGKVYGPAGEVMQDYFTALWQEIASPDLSLASRDRVNALNHYLDEADAMAAQANDPALEQRLQEAHAFQAHCIELKEQIARNYNADGSPKSKLN